MILEEHEGSKAVKTHRWIRCPDRPADNHGIVVFDIRQWVFQWRRRTAQTVKPCADVTKVREVVSLGLQCEKLCIQDQSKSFGNIPGMAGL